MQNSDNPDGNSPPAPESEPGQSPMPPGQWGGPPPPQGQWAGPPPPPQGRWAGPPPPMPPQGQWAGPPPPVPPGPDNTTRNVILIVLSSVLLLALCACGMMAYAVEESNRRVNDIFSTISSAL